MKAAALMHAAEVAASSHAGSRGGRGQLSGRSWADQVR
jgi:hypothetical protein